MSKLDSTGGEAVVYTCGQFLGTKEFFMKRLISLSLLSCLVLTFPALAQTHGFYWTSSGGVQDIGTLDVNCSPCNSYARGINRAGQVVGASGFGFLQQPYHAMEWTKAAAWSISERWADRGAGIALASRLRLIPVVRWWGSRTSRARTFRALCGGVPREGSPRCHPCLDAATAPVLPLRLTIKAMS